MNGFELTELPLNRIDHSPNLVASDLIISKKPPLDDRVLSIPLGVA